MRYLLATQGLWNKLLDALLVLRDQAGRGQVLIMPEAEARSRFPNLVVASPGAQKKEKPGGVVSARVLFDGTNGNFVNTSTHLRDQERAPVAPDLKRLMREKAKTGEVTFGLTADVKRSTQTGTCWDVSSSVGGEVFVNTFGVSSASYYWSRVSAAVGRLTQYLISRYATTWIMLLADDYHVEVGGQHFRPALLVRVSWLPTLVEQDERRDGDQLGRLRAPPEGTRPGTDRTKSSMGSEVGSRDGSSQGDPRPCVRGGAGKCSRPVHQSSSVPSCLPSAPSPRLVRETR